MAEAIILTKRCCYCKETKEASCFYKQSRRKDGLQDECKSCERDRRHSPHTRAKRNAAALRYQKTGNGKEIMKRTYQRSVIIGAVAARQAVFIAVAKGKLPRISTQKCSQCQGKAQHYHHHQGYSKENHLAVLPVCAVCHKKLG